LIGIGLMNEKEVLSNYFSKLGSKGGKKRAENLTKDQLAEIGKRAAAARWGKQKKAKPSSSKRRKQK
jgi:hypothetical protein